MKRWHARYSSVAHQSYDTLLAGHTKSDPYTIQYWDIKESLMKRRK